MGERALQPPDDVRTEARHLSRLYSGVDRDRLAWIGAGGHVGRSTLLALLASGVRGKVGIWASKSYGKLIDSEHRDAVLALTAAAVAPDGRYYGICHPDERDCITAVVRASADGIDRWTGKGWERVPDDLAPVGLPYRELGDDLLPEALTACAGGGRLLLRAATPRAFLSKASTLTAAAGRRDGVYAVVDDVDTSAVLGLIKVEGQAHYRRTGGVWQYDDHAHLPYLVASGAPLAYVDPIEQPLILRTFDDHEAVFPLLAADTAPDGPPKAAGLAVKAADTGRALMLQRGLTPDDPAAGDWEFPGGHLDPGEDPYDAATREWAEETGMPVPDGELTGAWRSPDGVYQGHVLTVPSEFDPTEGRDQVTNPDDPDGDQVESLAWWEPQDMVDNPAVRTELSNNLDDVLGALTLGDQADDQGDSGEEGITAARHVRGEPFRYRHNWIPVGGAPMPLGKALSKLGIGRRSKRDRAVNERISQAAEASLKRAREDVANQRGDAEMHQLGDIGRGEHGDVLNYRDHMGIDRGDMPQLSGNVGGRYIPSAELTPQFLDDLRSRGVGVHDEQVPADTLKATQTTGDPVKIRQMADRFMSGASRSKPIVVSKDSRVLDGHHNWAGQRIADAESGKVTPMPVHRVDLPMTELLKHAARFSASKGIKNRKQGEFANPDFAMTNPILTAAAITADSSLEDDEAFTSDGQPEATDPNVDTQAADPGNNNLMVGLPVDPDTAAQLATDGGLSPDEMHVTLVDLGDPEQAGIDPDSLAELVAQWATQQQPVTGSLSGPATFTAASDGQDAHVALVDAPGLAELRDNLSQHLASAGVNIPPDKHGFSPHITRAYGDPVEPVAGGAQVSFPQVGVYAGPERRDIPFAAVTAAFWDPKKHPRGFHGRFGHGTGTRELTPREAGEAHGRSVLERAQADAAKLGPGPDRAQFTARSEGHGKIPYAGRFDDRGPKAPLNDQEYEQHTARIEQTLADAIGRGENTDAKYAIDVEKGLWQPERAAIHKQMVNDIYGRQAATAKSTGDALIMGGLGGAGKSTILKNHLGIDSADWVTVNPDDVKEEMARLGLVPKVQGLSPMEASALIHEESSHIANLIAARALAEKKNIIYDITMSSKGSVQKRLQKLAAHGYKKPQGVFVDIPVETSVSRALGRHRHGMEEHRAGKGLGGRYVPPSVIRKSGSSTSNSANRDVFNALAHEFGTKRVFDTSGQGAREIPFD